MLKAKTAQIVEENKLRRRADEEMLVYKNKAQMKKSTLSAGLEAEVNAYKVFICAILHTFVDASHQILLMVLFNLRAS